MAAALKRWGQDAGQGRASFAQHFFGRDAQDRLAGQLHDVAAGVASATSFADLRDAAGQLAGAIQAVGLDGWSRFLADAEDHAARQPTTALQPK